MFDLSWAELGLVMLVAILVIGPKDLPVAARTLGRWIGKAKRAASDLYRLMEEAGEETGIKQAGRDIAWESTKVRKLIDLDGNEQLAYDIDDVEKSLGVNLKRRAAPKKPRKRPARRTPKKKA